MSKYAFYFYKILNFLEIEESYLNKYWMLTSWCNSIAKVKLV